MVLNVKIKIDLGDAFTDYDRMALGDLIIKELQGQIKKHKNITLSSIKGEIEKEKKIGP